MSRNTPSLAYQDEITMQHMSVSEIEMMLEELATLKAKVTRYGNLISCELSRRFADDAAALRRNDGKETGTVRIVKGDHVIVADLPKSVEWDQCDLAQLAIEIGTWDGEAISDYMSVKYSVDERKFTAWPPSLQKSFEPARTVKTGKATYKIESKKEAA